MRAFAIASTASFLLSGVLLSGCGDDPASGNEVDATGGAASGGTGSGGTGGTTSSTGGTASGGSAAGGTTANVSFNVQKVTTWRNDAKAAYTMFHDDTCASDLDSQLSAADPALAERGLVASFGAIASACEDRDMWSSLETLRSHGHEIVSHSWDHPNFLNALGNGATVPQLESEQIDAARASLEAHLQSYTTTFFIFPEDAFNDDFLAYLDAQGYLGARAGERGHNPSNFDDDFRLKFDVFGPGFSIYTYEGAGAGTPCASAVEGETGTGTDECRMYILDHYVDEVIADGGYGIREMHGVGGPGNAWEPVPTALYEQHLDYVKSKVDAGELWVGTASDVIRYRRAREACSLPTAGINQLTFGAPNAECTLYATALSYVVSAVGAAPTDLVATQGGATLPVKAQVAGTFLVTADPTKGPITLTPAL